jgi:hypothetical protein
MTDGVAAQPKIFQAGNRLRVNIYETFPDHEDVPYLRSEISFELASAFCRSIF